MVYLSVIIPTRNRSPLLAKLLSSLNDQTLSRGQFEVIVIDNGSSDSTKEICNKYGNVLPCFRYVYDEQPGLHVGRHRGLKEASGDILVFCDDDIEALPTWLAGIAESFSDSSVMLVGGNNYPNYEIPPPSWIRRAWEDSKNKNGYFLGYFSILNFGKQTKGISPYFVWGCNFSIRKKILIKAGGFHPDAMPQELIKFRGDGETYVSRYIAEKGYKALFNHRASVRHYVPATRMTVKYIQRRVFNQGISDSYTFLRDGNPPKFKSYPSAIKDLKKNLFPLKPINIFRALKENFSRNELNLLKQITKKPYIDGYNFHHSVYLNDPNIRNWVHKQNYYG